MAVFLYLPFLMVAGVASRFLFMAQAPLCLLMALPLSRHASSTIKRRLRWVLPIATVGILIYFARITHGQNSNLSKASKVGRTLLERPLEIELRTNSTVVFEGVPDSADGYPLF